MLEVSGDEGWEEWTEVADFAGSTPTDRHFVLEMSGGEIRLGPAVREADGTIRQYGAVPAKNARLRMRSYRTGGGRKDNLAARSLTVLKSSIPFVARVENRRAASGGVDGEDIENAKVRGPIRLRTRGRAVTTEDFEHLAREAAPEVARIRAVAAGDGADAGSVRVLVVPAAAPADGAYLRFDQLVPGEETLQAITDRLEEARVIGTRAIVEPPVYRGVTVVAKLKARPRQNPGRLQDDALKALYAYFDPITGGPEGTGWPFGRPVNVGEVYSVLQGLRGTELVEDARLFGPTRSPANAASRPRGSRSSQRARLLHERRSCRGRLTVRGTVAAWPARARWGRRCRPWPGGPFALALGSLDTVPRAGHGDARQPRHVLRPVPDARRLPLLARDVGRDEVDDSWTIERRREAVARAVELYRLRGTATGLQEQIEIHTGGSVEIIENGGTAWSIDPGGELPGSPKPLVVVRVQVDEPKSVDAGRIEALVAAAKPAHVEHRVEIVKLGGKKGSAKADAAADTPPDSEGDAGAPSA